MKLLLLSPVPPPAGGIATWTQRFLNSEIIKNNVNVTLIDTSVKGKRKKNLSEKKILEEVKRAAALIKELDFKLKKENYDIVHINTSCSKLGLIRDYILCKLIKNSNSKLILHCHCDTTYMVKGILSDYFFKRICNTADVILVLNNVSKNHIEKISKKEVKLVPNFINEDEILNYHKKVNQEVKEIIYVGHVVKLKGCLEIIKVATYFPEITFKLMGYIGKDFEEINIPENVILTGELDREKVIKEMQKADVFLFPTYTEGFPNVILEAMASGLPIISTSVGAIPDIIENKGGIIVEKQNITDLINAIYKIMEVNIRKEMSYWNLQQVSVKYTTESVLSSLIHQYLSLIK